ncbi:hypothetical protein JHJ32_00610 [Parapedobacter sp. ISTM3]|uniref:hypothetical protein n=1 Tax=Parapedobacter sp. ISTM3 TaxID=2800130 RepID=UPI001907EFF2|nr:hypothetical protein [Parapedobacter sp. ISTM3]MBK1438473.1 hypothetical protein [Parapedobacter sp. ISTM3]
MKKQKDNVSPWSLHLTQQLLSQAASVVTEKQLSNRTVKVIRTDDALAVCVHQAKGTKLVFRAAYTPAADLTIAHSRSAGAELSYTLRSAIGRYRVVIWMDTIQQVPMLRYVTHFTPRDDFRIPFWPKDVLILNPDGGIGGVEANIHVEQLGLRSGMVYFSITEPAEGSALYLQNLTALNNYCADTGTSVAGTVDGKWPEFGFAPPATTDKPLCGGKEYTIGDAFVAFADRVPTDQFDKAKQFTDLLAGLYVQLPKPPTAYHDYVGIAAKALQELATHKGCWSHHQGHSYLNAYVCDYKTPPEIMVQLAVLLPLKEYEEWMGEEVPLIAEIEAGLPEFYDANVGTVRRWLPAADHQLDGSEEQKQVLVMDSWYLHHPLLNLSRMALHGDEVAKDLFLKSLDYTIQVAHHFDYKWPVFYKMDTLEVVKAETKPGAGGEKDVGGIYAHVMLQAWDLTGDDKYLREAKKAAQSLVSAGFDLFYQANNTAFAAGAMLRLWKATKDEVYLDLGYLLMANVFKNLALWDCRYGYGNHFPLFFAVFPLNDAPYTAVYEEVEVFAAVHEYLSQADDTPLSRSYALLLAEFIRYALHRMVHYYPTVLPREMLANDVKTGEIDPNLWVPLEDINPGWDKSGSVGQEVYGAAFPFAVIPRHYMKIAGGAYLLFVDYPTAERAAENRELRFKVLGDERLSCKLYILRSGTGESLDITVSAAQQGGIKPQTVGGDTVCYEVHGKQHVVISW